MPNFWLCIGRLAPTSLKKQKEQGWATQVIAQLSKDLTAAFPDGKGYLNRNLRNMKSFAEAYLDFLILQVPLAKLKDENKKCIFK